MSGGRARGPSEGVATRRVALDALVRIERDEAYANLALPAMLDRSALAERDRRMVTELVYGTTRMRRACDWLVDRFLDRDVEVEVRAALRLGAYQLVYLGTPAHAAVDATVGAAPGRARGLVNAVLRRVAAKGVPDSWPGEGVRLSYPDWIVELLVGELGATDAVDSLEWMNRAPAVTERADGYVQDLASQWVVDEVRVEPGSRVADLCAAPGGKATRLAELGAWVAASDISEARAGLVRTNVERLGATGVVTVAADGRQPPFVPACFDRVLVDAPCSGLGVLRRRPDARWRVRPEDVPRLGELQLELVRSAAALLRPGGLLVYSVCTLTRAETVEIDRALGRELPELAAVAPPGPPWGSVGRGARLLPQWADTDGMYLLVLRG